MNFCFVRMEIKIIEEKKNHLILEAEGVSHGFCNAIIKELWNDKDTKSAGYNIDHPLVGIPKIMVESKGDAKKSLVNAITRLKKTNETFKKEFLKEVKK